MFDFLKRKLDHRDFVFELTKKCNHECKFCYNAWKNNEFPDRELNTSEWKKVIDKLKEKTKVELISLSGGEPLIRNDVPELARYSKNKEIDTNLITNGTLIDENTAEKCVNAGISLFEVSLLSHDRKTYRKQTGCGELKKAVQGIKKIKEAGGKVVTVFVATKNNIDQLQETVELMVALEADGIMFNRINPSNKEQIKLMPSKSKLEEALEFLDDFSGRYGLPVSCSIPFPPCIINMEKFENISHGFCPSGDPERSYYTVGPSGNVRVCNHSPKRLGNILEKSLEDIIENEYVKKFKKALPDYCKGCEKAKKCWGGCKAAGETCYGNLESKDPFLKKYSS